MGPEKWLPVLTGCCFSGCFRSAVSVTAEEGPEVGGGEV